MTSPTRWAGVPLSDRRAERRSRLVEAAYTLFGLEGDIQGSSERSNGTLCTVAGCPPAPRTTRLNWTPSPPRTAR